ncbi:MAG TPA: hypothetical protein VLX11_05645 [Candidatus Acidoferrales bacterium]|nr:hypothetical protein [Candidatus Acidoferrales bacterium]
MPKKTFRLYLLALIVAITQPGFAFAQAAKTKPAATARPQSGQTEPSCKEAKNVILRNNDPAILKMAIDHSERCKEVAIMIAKGAQDEANLTGEVIGNILVEEIEKHGVPAKFFVAPGGDFTLVAFYVSGESITKAPVGLDVSRSAANLAVAAWQSKYADSSKRDH